MRQVRLSNIALRYTHAPLNILDANIVRLFVSNAIIRLLILACGAVTDVI